MDQGGEGHFLFVEEYITCDNWINGSDGKEWGY
jgi:hypothetical protein